jgi:hypothetical protein
MAFLAQWEYQIVDLGSMRPEQAQIILNSLGEQGWELVAITHPLGVEESAALGGMVAAFIRFPAPKTLAYFKRQKSS